MSSLIFPPKSFRFLTLILIVGLLLAACGPAAQPTDAPTVEEPAPTKSDAEAQETQEPLDTEPAGSKMPIVDDFESGELPEGTNANGLDVGYVLWGDSASTVSIDNLAIPAEDDLAKPGQSSENQVLALTAEVSGWGGVTHNFENATVDTWMTLDWSTYEGVSFWVYGLDSGVSLFFEIQENRNPDSTTNDVEIWSYPFEDDFSGWQQIQIPWEDFSRKDIGNGAPNDGLGLREVHGWAFGMLTTPAEETNYLDDIELYGERDPMANLEVAFNHTQDVVREGGRDRLEGSLSAVSEK